MSSLVSCQPRTGLTCGGYDAPAPSRVAAFEVLEPRLLLSSSLYWDPDGVAANNNIETGSGLGGTGTWDTASARWYDPVLEADVAWSNANGDDAVFLNTAGTVTLSAGINAGSLAFGAAGYILQGGTLTLSGDGGQVAVDTDDAGSATVASVHAPWEDGGDLAAALVRGHRGRVVGQFWHCGLLADVPTTAFAWRPARCLAGLMLLVFLLLTRRRFEMSVGSETDGAVNWTTAVYERVREFGVLLSACGRERVGSRVERSSWFQGFRERYIAQPRQLRPQRR
jgi:hypothetical protein